MPAVAIQPRRLLVHADELINHHAGAGRPKVVWVRRGVSAAYYAAFHAVGLMMSRQLLPDSSAEDRQRLSRSLDHKSLGVVSAWVSKGTPPKDKAAAPLVRRAHEDTRVARMARLLGELQDARHLADYDHVAPVDKAGAKLRVRQAAQVLDTLNIDTPGLHAYLALLALHTNLR